MTFEKQVWFRVLALGLPYREVLYVTRRSTFHSGRYYLGLPGREIREVLDYLGLPSREVLYVTLEEHVLVRALATDSLIGRPYS